MIAEKRGLTLGASGTHSINHKEDLHDAPTPCPPGAICTAPITGRVSTLPAPINIFRASGPEKTEAPLHPGRVLQAKATRRKEPIDFIGGRRFIGVAAKPIMEVMVLVHATSDAVRRGILRRLGKAQVLVGV